MMPEVFLESKAHGLCWGCSRKIFGSVDPGKLSINIWNPQNGGVKQPI